MATVPASMLASQGLVLVASALGLILSIGCMHTKRSACPPWRQNIRRARQLPKPRSETERRKSNELVLWPMAALLYIAVVGVAQAHEVTGVPMTGGREAIGLHGVGSARRLQAHSGKWLVYRQFHII